MRFVIAQLKSGKFLTEVHTYTANKQEALVFETEDKALAYCRSQYLLASHVPVPVPKEHLAKKKPLR